MTERMKRWVATRLRYAADRIDRDSALKGLHWTFTYEAGEGIRFREDGRGCALWYLGRHRVDRISLMKRRIAWWLRGVADRIDYAGAPKLMHWTFTHRVGVVTRFREDGVGVRLWHLGDDEYEKAWTQADRPQPPWSRQPETDGA